MTATFDDLWGDVFFSANERVGAKIGDTGFGVDGRERGGRGAAGGEDHGGNAAGFGLFREIEIGKHDMAGLVE